MTLSWTANGEADLAGYRVLRDGVQVASLGKVTSYVDTGLLSTQSYTYVLRAVDTAGNVSGDSAIRHGDAAAQDDERGAQRVVQAQRDLGHRHAARSSPGRCAASRPARRRASPRRSR